MPKENWQQVKGWKKGAHVRTSNMDAVGRVRIQVALVVPGRHNTYVSGNMHRSLSIDHARVSEVIEEIAKALNLEYMSDAPTTD